MPYQKIHAVLCIGDLHTTREIQNILHSVYQTCKIDRLPLPYDLATWFLYDYVDIDGVRYRRLLQEVL